MAPEVSVARTKNGGDAVARVEQQFDAEETADLRMWLQSVGSPQDVSVKVVRKGPRVFQGISIEGTLDTINDFIDEEFIKERWGGGLYTLNVMKRDKSGSMRYAGSKTVRIAGAPRMDDYVTPPAAGADGGAVAQAMAMAQRQTELAQERAERAQRQNHNGLDPALLHALTAPMQAQIEASTQQTIALQHAISEKDARMMEIISHKPDDTFKDVLISKMFDGENAKINALREQHASEIRLIREGARQDIERERERISNEIKTLEKRHEREIEMMKSSHKMTAEAQKISYDTRIDGLQAEIKRVERELSTKEKELSELRAKKDKSILENAKEIVELKTMLTDIGIGGDDDDDEDDNSPWWQKAGRAIVENPEAIGQFIGGVKASAGGQQPMMPGQPMQHGQVMQGHVPQMIAPSGSAQLRKRQLKAARRQAALAAVGAQSAGAQTPAATAVPTGPVGNSPASGNMVPAAAEVTPPVVQTAVGDVVRPPDAQELALAVSFMENALIEGTEAEMFAQAARAVIPDGVLAYISKIGVDDFLSTHVQLSEGSPLRSLRGRNFAREVFRLVTASA